MTPPAHGTSHTRPGTASFFGRVSALVRRIIGVPDYVTYREHMAACHPELPVLSEQEFAEDRLVAKYSKPGQRCC